MGEEVVQPDRQQMSGTAPGQPGIVADGVLTQFGERTALDLLTLALLHDRELGAARILQLRRDDFPDCLALQLRSEAADTGLRLLRAAVTDLWRIGLDELAADFAAIYLNHSYRASPCESVWIDEEGLAMQDAMFEVRDCYAAYGMGVQDWRKRSDDHLVHELQFVAELLSRGRMDEFATAAGFLDEHLLCWLPAFAGRVAARCQTPFYAGLAMLTAAYLDELRDLLARLTGQPRLSTEEREQRRRQQSEQRRSVPAAYLPGIEPSW